MLLRLHTAIIPQKYIYLYYKFLLDAMELDLKDIWESEGQ